VDPVTDPLLFFLVVPGIELGLPDLEPRTLTTRPQRRSSTAKYALLIAVGATAARDRRQV
jgi:hypothetical protein